MSGIRIRHIISLVMVILLLLSLALPVLSAGNAEISVTVPAEHTVTVSCGTGGKVTVGQTDYTGTNGFTVARYGDFSLTALPDSGYELVSVTGNSVCQMTFDQNGATLKQVNKDTLITVVFRAVVNREAPVEILIPVTSQNKSIAAEAVITDNEASIALDQAEFEAFLGDDTDPGTVSVDISNVGVDINTVNIPVSTVRAIAEKSATDSDDSPGLSISLPHSEVTFDSDALTSIVGQAADDTVRLNVTEVEAESLTANQQATIKDIPGNKVVVSITLLSGETNISNFDNGSLDIKLPYTPQANEDTGTITVWYVSRDGHMEEIPCRYENGYVAFTVYHLSDYLIKPGVISVVPEVDSHCFICGLFGHNINPWCWLLPLFLLIAAVATVFAIVFVKNKRSKQH